MEANRDAAEQYFDLAMDKLHSKEYEKALQFLLKSQELYPSKTTETKINKLRIHLSKPKETQQVDEKTREKQEKKLQQEEESKFPKEQIDEIKSKIKSKG
jgi:hypothetical protein